MTGKVSPEDLKRFVFSRTGADDDDVLVGPKYGEDTAAIRIGDKILVVNSDPISFAADRIGTLGVHVACNDIVASGAEPRWLTNIFFLPENGNEILDRITEQIDKEAKKLGISVVGGHSEYTPDIDRPLVSMTCMGVTDRYISSSGAKPGDRIILTKGAGVEGTGIIATDFRGSLEGKVAKGVIRRAEERLNDISIIEEGRIVSKYANSMHDPTEGGVLNGLIELAVASGAEFDVKKEDIPVKEETRKVCEVMNVDPLRIFGSGSLLATVPEGAVEDVLGELEKGGIDASVIGRVRKAKEPKVVLNGQVYRSSIRDEMYDLWS